MRQNEKNACYEIKNFETDQPNSLLLYHDLITGIVTAMEARDAYTASHSMRVSDMTEQICELLQLEESLTETIHIAAHVHDIGKIGIEDSILRKDGPLDAEEWIEMRQHPTIGHAILNKVGSFEQIATIVRHHHERWDGKGYPDGIQGKRIPLGSRIIAIADSIDAMMSNRLYRKRMSSHQCKLEIERNSNIMYDPFISQLVLKNWFQIVEKRNDFA